MEVADRTMKHFDTKIVIAGNQCREDVADILRTLGYLSVSEFEDGVSVWDHLKKREAGIVFADWTLGQFDGLVLLKLMRADANLADIPIVLMCTRINREMVIDAGHAGVTAILIRPFTNRLIREKMSLIFEIVSDAKLDVEAEALMEAGRVYTEKGEHEKALKQFNKVLELYENPEVYYNIGYIMAARKRYDDSITAFRKAINIDRNFAKAFQALGEVYLKVGQKDKAEEMLQRAGEIYMEKNMSQEAEIAFQEVLKLNPNTTNIYNSLGILYRRNNDFNRAMSAYEKALRVDPEDENIFFNLGRACYDAGLFKRSRLYLNRALEICPDFNEAKILISRIDTSASENS